MQSDFLCVLVPYFEAGDKLLVSLSSIEQGSLQPHIVLVDDGSKVIPARSMLEKYKGHLEITLIELAENRGIAVALNHGLDYAKDHWELIARLDCGDLCKSDRLRKQSNFLIEHPNCMMLGSWATFVDEKGDEVFLLQQPANHDSILKAMRINCAFTHPTIILRSCVVRELGSYPTNYAAAEDYAYFFAIVSRYSTANFSEPLVSCLVDPNGISSIKRRTQILSRIRLMWKYYDWSALATYGILRAFILLLLPRSASLALNRFKQILMARSR
ncbi:glycosyltransferase [Pusillimonas sp.]|uniref:glycosyltransferase n=1 Tax=Pusillimonas sp. TaxID=3040095 RepID=UPI0029AED579|nr:glycosyltransferase [Pusillimonas sp.]MDX3895320.1 glycosyltransferase [Pusillimonas sp.]